MYITDEREREREREKTHLCVYVSTSFLPSGRSLTGVIVFFICVDTLLYTMTFLGGKYAHSCRFKFLPTKINHKKFVKIHQNLSPKTKNGIETPICEWKLIDFCTVANLRFARKAKPCSAKAALRGSPPQLWSSAFDIKSDSLGFFDLFSNTERERGKSCLHSKVVKFDHFKVRVVFICK